MENLIASKVAGVIYLKVLQREDMPCNRAHIGLLEEEAEGGGRKRPVLGDKNGRRERKRWEVDKAFKR